MDLMTTEQLADLEWSAFLLSEEIQSQQIMVSDIEFIPWQKVNNDEMYKSMNRTKCDDVRPFRLCKSRYR